HSAHALGAAHDGRADRATVRYRSDPAGRASLALSGRPAEGAAMISVWAPRAQRMRVRRVTTDGAVVVDERELTASEDRTGWWWSDVDLADGDRYGFVIDDGDQLRADPRSRRQPDGVHSASAAFDAS